jgi:hypothetical protein
MKIPCLALCATLFASALAPADAAADEGNRCARVSVFDSAPRKQDLYPAVLIAIDGSMPGPTQATTWRVTPGKHTLTVAEAIEPHEFSTPQLRQRDGRKVRPYKTLEIDAQPGITYRLAAQFIAANRSRIDDGSYWEPVIWKESPEACR